ncbi:hypothetical protein [Streptomyces sp. N50]|uniref:hypothetical protein n=1 Tax=Streptomyces sp. N50 TaxID=3081765 RepID=UPI00296241B7|nr:hypothetical protein [Streptomyces sp. N50]WOX16540.1 hypothetical protein R2B38_47935 [Streptomyces sp. N50]
MSNSSTASPTIPHTVWLARGRHVGSADAADVVRRQLQRLKDREVIDDHLEPDEDQHEDPRERVFEARWRVEGTVTVRARLTFPPAPEPASAAAASVAVEEREWLLVAEAERVWDPRWPSPATMFWPDNSEEADAGWDHVTVPGLRFGQVNPLPSDEKELRRLFRSCAQDGWSIHVVVHEAMTPDAHGRQPLARLLPASLQHCVVEHRATPDQLRSVNWALLREFDFQVPRGGAVILPTSPVAPSYDVREFSVRSVFLDGSEPTELVDVLCRYAASARPLPDGGQEAVTALHEQWKLMTMEEELARERRLVAMYAEALEAMTKSRDLYRESADRANEALAALRDSAGAAVPGAPSQPGGSPFQRTFGRLRDATKALRPAAPPTDSEHADPPSDGERSAEER